MILVKLVYFKSKAVRYVCLVLLIRIWWHKQGKQRRSCSSELMDSTCNLAKQSGLKINHDNIIVSQSWKSWKYLKYVTLACDTYNDHLCKQIQRVNHEKCHSQYEKQSKDVRAILKRVNQLLTDIAKRFLYFIWGRLTN